MSNNPGSFSLYLKLARPLCIAAIFGLMTMMAGAGIASRALADEPMEDTPPAKPADLAPPEAKGPPPSGGINLFSMQAEWPKKPYPVPLRKVRKYPPYGAEAYSYGPRERDHSPAGYPEKPDYADGPRYRKPERYSEPRYEPKPTYAEKGGYPGGAAYPKLPGDDDDRFEPRFEVDSSAKYSKRGENGPDRAPYAKRGGYGAAPYAEGPKYSKGDDYPDRPPYYAKNDYAKNDYARSGGYPEEPRYAGPREYPKQAYGVSIGGPRRPDPELPLAPDFELNRHRGFGRLFPVLDPADRGGRGLPAQASRLGELRALGEVLKEPGDPNDPAGDSDMPAGYTFLALLVDHDLTFDLSTSLAKGVRGDEVANTRTPEFDLDNVYGQGPIATPYLFKLPYLRTGRLIAGEAAYVRHDVLRAEAKDRPGPPGGAATAIIGDPRDDENFIISQLHAAVVSFHNRTVDVLVSRRFGRHRYKYCKSNICSIYRLADALPPQVKFEIFEKARDHVLHYYHRVIAEDLLPRLIGYQRTADIFSRGRDFYFPRGFRGQDGRLRDAYIPVEFAVAGFRYGHSQARSFYQIRSDYRVSLFRGEGGSGIQAFQPVTRRQLVDWRYFFEIDETPPPNFNWARRIDPLVTAALHNLNRTNVVGPKDLGSLPARNLQRGRVFYLPSGQTVAAEILPVLEKRGVLPDGYGKGGDRKGYRGGWQAFLLPPNERTRTFLGPEETPLWYYVLQEAEVFGVSRNVAYTPAYAGAFRGGPRVGGADYEPVAYSGGPRRRGYGDGGYGEGGHSLGPVGSTIVGEVLVGLLEHFREKTGKGLGYDPEVRGSTSAYADGYGKGGRRPRYLMRNFLIDAGVVEPY